MKSVITQIVVLTMASVLTLGSSSLQAAKPESSSAKSMTSTAQVTVVNINKASAAEIAKQLKGIGLKRAEAIVALRKQLGGFKKVEQLLDVKGIGEATLKKNRTMIRL